MGLATGNPKTHSSGQERKAGWFTGTERSRQVGDTGVTSGDNGCSPADCHSISYAMVL